MNQTTSTSSFACVPSVRRLLELELYHGDVDAPITEHMLNTVLKKVERKLNTLFELNSGYSVYVDQQTELLTSDLGLLSETYMVAKQIAKLVDNCNAMVKLYSVHGDMFVKKLN